MPLPSQKTIPIQKSPGLLQPVKAADVISVSPSTLMQGQNYSLILVTRNFGRSMGLSFGEGVVVKGIQYLSDTTARVDVSVLQNAALGKHEITITSSNNAARKATASITVIAQPSIGPDGNISAPQADVISVTPSTLLQGQIHSLTLTTRNLAERMELGFGEGITVLGRPTVGATMSVSVQVSPNAPLGKHRVTIRYGNQITDSSAFVEVKPSSPVPPAPPAPQPGTMPTSSFMISMITPNIWYQGESYFITLQGSNFTKNMEVNFGAGVEAKTEIKVLSGNLAQMEVAVSESAEPVFNRQVKARLDSNQTFSSTQTGISIYPVTKVMSGKAGAPIRFKPLDMSFEKGEIILTDPRWGIVELPNSVDHATTDIGAPLLDDSVVFKWKEQNPGLADYFEFRILDTGGKILKTIKIDGIDIMLPGGRKVRQVPTYFRPDAEFLAEFLNPQISVTTSSTNTVTASQNTAKSKKVTKVSKTDNSNQETDKQIKYPEETELFWEVAGYRIYNSNGTKVTEINSPMNKIPVVTTAPLKDDKKTGRFQQTGKAQQSVSLQKAKAEIQTHPGSVNMTLADDLKSAEQVGLEVEISERWPLSRPDKPTGIKACPASGITTGSLNIEQISEKCVLDREGKCKTQKVKKKVKNIWMEVEETVVDNNIYPGDVLRMSGKFTLEKSPYAAHSVTNPAQSASGSSGQCEIPPCIDNINFNAPSEYVNVVLDWGDGTVVHPLTLKTTKVKKDKGSHGETGRVEYEILDNVIHTYEHWGSYHIRIYQLSNDELQGINIDTLTQQVDENRSNPYFKIVSTGANQSSSGNKALDVAGRAYVIYCKTVDIREVEDIDATGPLHLESIEISGFPGHDAKGTESKSDSGSGNKQAAESSSVSAKDSVSQTQTNINVTKSSSVSAVQKQNVSKAGVINLADAAAATCDESLMAEAKLNYYGTGNARIRWMRDGVVLRQEEHHVPESESRKNLERDPSEWPPIKISVDATLPNSGNLLKGKKDIGKYSVTIDAEVLFNLQSPDLGKSVSFAIDNPQMGVSLNKALNSSQNGKKSLKIGYMSPYKSVKSGMPQVAYVNDSLAASASKVTFMKEKPYFVESSPKTYLVTASDPNQPCTFVFPTKEDGEFRISGLQNNVTKQGTKYSGRGNLLFKFTKDATDAEEYSIPVTFQNWEVPDGMHVKSGKLLATIGKEIQAPGLLGTLDKIEGTAGDKVNAVLTLNLYDTLRVEGIEKPHVWKNLSAPVTSEGDWFVEKLQLPRTLIGWSSFKIESNDVTIDLSRKKGSRSVSSLCGTGGGAKWVGVHLGNATLIPYTMDLVGSGSFTPTVSDWAVITPGICGEAKTGVFDAKIGEGSIHFDSIDVRAKDGTFEAIYKNMIVHVPWLDTDMKGDAKLHYQGGGDKGIIFPLSGTVPLREYGNIKMKANNLAFVHEENIGWAVRTGTRFDFIAEAKPFTQINVPELFFDMHGRSFFAKGATSKTINLTGSANLGKTVLDLVSVDLDTKKTDNDRLKFNINTRLRLSDVLPLADVQVLYSIVRPADVYSGTGPVTGPFAVKAILPAGQPTVDATIQPVYAPKSNQETRYLGTIDIGLFGGPPIKAEFLLGYKGNNDYWLTRASIPLGHSGIPIAPPFLSLYMIRGGLGYNFPIDAFKNAASLETAVPDMKGDYIFMAGMRVGAPSKFPYMLDGDFTVRKSGAARMDYHAWLMTTNYSGQGSFHGYFQYASGNFDGMLAGKLSLFGDAIYVEAPANAATLHFGGGNWHIHAGKKDGPRLKAHMLIRDTTGYFMIGNEGVSIGGGMSSDLKAEAGPLSGHVYGSYDIGVAAAPGPHVSGYAKGKMGSELCAYDVCIGPSLSAKIDVEAMPISIKTHACVVIPIPLWNPEVCGSFSY